MKIRYYLLYLLLSIISLTNIYSQAIYFGPDESVNTGDSVVIRLRDYFGSVQWQKSFNLEVWQDIPNATKDTILFIADTSTYFRAQVTAGNCPIYNSDTTYINVSKVKSTTKKIDTRTIQLISDSLQLSDGIYIFKNASVDDFSIGSIITNNQQEGFLRKVSSISSTDSSVILLTEQAKLTDAIEYCDIQDSILIILSNLKSTNFHNGKEIPMQIKNIPEGVSLKSTGSGLNLNNKTLYSGTLENGTNVSISITEGEINFDPIFERELKIGLGVQYFKLAAGGELSLDMDLLVECDKEFSYSNEIKIGPTFFIGPIPLTGILNMYIEFDFYAGFEASANIKGTTTTRFESAYMLKFGAEYDKQNNPKWDKIWQKNGHFEFSEPSYELGAEVNAKVFVKPMLSVTIARAVGPYLAAKPYLRFEGGVIYPDWYWLLAAGIDADLGFRAEILGYEIVDFYTTLANWEKILAENSGNLTFNLPSLITNSITNITTNSANSGGNITDNGGAIVTARGVCWSTSQYPTTSNIHTTNGSGTGSFTSYLTGLSPNTTYYVRAYATNSKGTSYGNQRSFTTDKNIILPTVSTNSVTDIGTNSANSGGNVTDDGEATVIARGVCWSTSQNPTTSDNHTTDGSGTGTFTSILTNLSPNTPYYLRAYATNSTGTAYGNQINFTTENNSNPAGILAYYTFSGNANDVSGNNNNGIVHGATLTSDRFGNPNSAYNFDGTDDYIVIPHSSTLNITDEITISYWVKLETSAPYYYPYHIIEKYGSWGSGQREWDINFVVENSEGGDNGLLWNTNLSNDVFYNFTFTYDGSILKSYKNGELTKSENYPEKIPESTSDIYIGEYFLGGNYYFDGIIDDIVIYNRALNASEVLDIYSITD